VCRNCRGQGEIIDEKDKCKACNGKKTVRDRKILEVNVEKGMRDGQKIIFSGEGDQEPELQPGDIVIVLDEKEHPVFKRSGQDLIMQMPLLLVESLCGFQKVIKTLDNRDLVITSFPGEIIKHEQIKCVLGEGMPQHKNPFEKGRLIIQFNVMFPESLPVEVLPALESALPARPVVTVPEHAEECNMVSSNLN
jgi:DnaJ family protein A protein 1